MDRATLSSLNASDAAVSLASLPRRFGEVFSPAERAGGSDAELAAASPEGNPSPLVLVWKAAAALSALNEAIGRVEVLDEPVLGSDLLDRDRRDTLSEPNPGGVEAALAALREASDALVAQVKAVTGHDWERTGDVGGVSVPAIELLREAVASGRTYLDELLPALISFRRGR